MRFLLFLSLLVFQLSLSAQLIPLWRKDMQIPTEGDTQVMYEMNSGNILLVRMDANVGQIDGIDVLQCLQPDGTLLWEYQDESALDNVALNFLDLAIDQNDNIYIAATNTPTNAPYEMAHYVKFDSSGNLIFNENISTSNSGSQSLNQIEINENGRIFGLATLDNLASNTLEYFFLELSPNGTILQQVLDTDYIFGESMLEGLDNGFNYACTEFTMTTISDSGQILNTSEYAYDSSWSVYSPDFIRVHNGLVYTYNRLGDEFSTATRSGISVFNENGSLVSSNEVMLQQVIPGWTSTLPTDFLIDENGNFYLGGTMYYSDGSGGGKGGGEANLFAIFLSKITPDFQVEWSVVYLEDNPDNINGFVHLYLHDNKPCVVFAADSFENYRQIVRSYDSSNGAVLWEHVDSSNSLFERTRPSEGFVSSTGELYTTGAGYLEEAFSEESSTFLYKYAIDNGSAVQAVAGAEGNKVWPNPVQSHLSISNVRAGDVCVVFDMQGRKLFETTLLSSNQPIDVSSLPGGVYVLRTEGSAHSSARFVKCN
jgi:hypothetical protein